MWIKPKPSEATAVPPTDYLDQRFFLSTLAGAVMLHLMGLYVWYVIPSMEVVNIPVHALSIKLGDGEPLTAEDLDTSKPTANAVDSAISQAVSSDDGQASKSAISSMEKALTSDSGPADKAIDKALAGTGNDVLIAESRKLSSAAKQFVRTNNVQAKGSSRGNSTAKDAEMATRYEQLVSDWIKKFQRYPMEARDKGEEGETVVRIRIDRSGTIRYRILEHSTGSPALDRAAIDMVNRANPVPAVPNDYPKDDLIEFLIPVNFTLQ